MIPISRLLAGSISLTFLVYVFVNTAMVTGLVPVVGVPLPLVSFGGTSMVTLMAGFGILMSIHSTGNYCHTNEKSPIASLHLSPFPLPPHAADRSLSIFSRTNVAAFIDEMVAEHDFDRDALAPLLAKAEIKQTIIKKDFDAGGTNADLGRIPQNLHYEGTHQRRRYILA